MAQLKTTKTGNSVKQYLDALTDKTQRQDCRALVKLMQRLTKLPPRMWGASIIGFGDMHCRYGSGREVEWFKIGFSPRKNNLSLYLMADFDKMSDLLAQLGKYKTGKSCLYVKTLSDIDLPVLEKLIARSLSITASK
jgi:Domain of unknown function (DU1801)